MKPVVDILLLADGMINKELSKIFILKLMQKFPPSFAQSNIIDLLFEVDSFYFIYFFPISQDL